jgi:hypothetical protein
MKWRLGFVVGYALLMGYAGGWREGLLALAGGLLGIWLLRVVDMIGDCIAAPFREFVEQREQRDRLVRELLARLEERR